MELNQLRYFHAVAKVGSFSGAADSLFVQQPTVSKMVRSLEEGLELELFERKKSGVLLTAEGQKLYSLTCGIFTSLEEFENSLKENTYEFKSLRIGATEPVSSYLLGSVVHSLQKAQPELEVVVLTSGAETLLESLKRGQVDVVLAYHTPKLGSEFRVYHKTSHEFFLVRSSKLKLTKESNFSFVGSREMDNKKNKKFPTFLELKKRFHRCQHNLSSNSLTLQKQLVLRGQVVGLLPGYAVKEELKRGDLVAMRVGQKTHYNLKYIVRTQSVDTIKVDALSNLIEEP